MTTKLAVFNNALLIIGERALASLSENREPRRLLDTAWDAGIVDQCLGAGQWKFAKRSIELASSTSIAPGFGYSKAFDVPADHVRTTALCSDPYLKCPLLGYTREGAYWFADVDPLYVSYVSNDAAYGGDLSLWPTEFCEYVEAKLASKIVHKLTQDKDEWKRVFALAKKLRNDAASGDAMEGPTQVPPSGAWVGARRGYGGGDRGRTNKLVG